MARANPPAKWLVEKAHELNLHRKKIKGNAAGAKQKNSSTTKHPLSAHNLKAGHR
jgi:hypothetical protein